MANLLIALYVLTTSSALMILKWGSQSGALLHTVNNKVSVNLNVYTFLGIVFYGISFLIYTYLISRYDLGYIIPLTTAFVYVAIFTGSYFLFKESFTAFKVAGIVLILGGIILLNLKK